MKKEKTVEPVQTEAAAPLQAEETVPAGRVKAEKPAKITKVGALLKEMRLQKSLKLADIAKKLCIRKLYLEAIEDGNYKEVPAFPYGVGFIRSYANYLGLNGDNIVELYKEETDTTERKDIHVLEPQPEATVPGLQYLLISLLALVLVYIGWSLFRSSDEEPLPQEDIVAEQTAAVAGDGGVIVVEDYAFEPPAEESEPAAEVPAAVETQVTVVEQSYSEPAAKTEDNTKAETKPATTAAEPEPAIDQNGVVIEVLKETWVEVKDGTRLYISKVLQAGDTYKVPEGRGMIVSFGKHDGANVYINGVLTKVAKPSKKTNIALDPFIKAEY